MAKEQTAEMYIGKYRTELPMHWLCGSADGRSDIPKQFLAAQSARNTATSSCINSALNR
jgi:hypothetical protein